MAPPLRFPRTGCDARSYSTLAAGPLTAGHPDGDVQPDPAVLALAAERRLVGGQAELLGHGQAALQVGLGQDEHELLAAIAGEGVDVADAAGDPPGDLDQDLVAPLVAEAALEVAGVPGPGERVGDRQPLGLGVQLDVLDGHRGLHRERGQGLGVAEGERLAVLAVVQAEHPEDPALGGHGHADLGGGGRLGPAVAGRAGQDHGPAGGRDRPRDPLADRDPLGRLALGEAVGGLADQGGPVGGEQQQAARLGPPGLFGELAKGPADQPGQHRAEQGGDQADDHQPQQHDGQVPSSAGTRSTAVRRPMVLATGTSPMTRVRSASRVPLASRWSSWLSIQMPARDRPEQAARRPRRGAAALAQVGAVALEHGPAADVPRLRRQQHAQGRPPHPGQEPGVGVAGPAQHPGVGCGHGQEVGRALAAQHGPHLGRVPGRHGLEQARVAGQGGHRLVGPLDPGGERHRGRPTGLLQLGADLALGRPGDRVPAVGGDHRHRQDHDDDEVPRESGSCRVHNRRSTGAGGGRLVHDGLVRSSPAGSSARDTMRSEGVSRHAW
jgi:hypothetical protein